MFVEFKMKIRWEYSENMSYLMHHLQNWDKTIEVNIFPISHVIQKRHM